MVKTEQTCWRRDRVPAQTEYLPRGQIKLIKEQFQEQVQLIARIWPTLHKHNTRLKNLEGAMGPVAMAIKKIHEIMGEAVTTKMAKEAKAKPMKAMKAMNADAKKAKAKRRRP